LWLSHKARSISGGQKGAAANGDQCIISIHKTGSSQMLPVVSSGGVCGPPPPAGRLREAHSRVSTNRQARQNQLATAAKAPAQGRLTGDAKAGDAAAQPAIATTLSRSALMTLSSCRDIAGRRKTLADPLFERCRPPPADLGSANYVPSLNAAPAHRPTARLG
jgi:hypothetical protein